MATLSLVLGDDLNHDSTLLTHLAATDDVLMVEHGVETAFMADGPPVHKRRIAYQLSAMRHFAERLRARGVRLHYRNLEATASADAAELEGTDRWASAVAAALDELRPARLRVTRPGDLALEERLEALCRERGIPLEVLEDAHFLTTPADFDRFMEGRKSPLLESFYRRVRRREQILMTGDGKPEGGAWNYDDENRESFGRDGPAGVPAQPSFPHDETSREVRRLVESRYASHPGRDAAFDLPVTPEEADAAVRRFTRERLSRFGAVQDAMWTGAPFLFHSRLSAPLNLKLLDPRRVVSAAEEAYHGGHAPLNAVEGFIRQIIGWREYVRGVYFHYMPEYASRNALGAREALPPVFWTGDSDMRCLREMVGGLLEHGYAHHIQRLMIAGLFAMLYGARPSEFNAWHIAMYIDAHDWVSVPNTIGMSLHADGGTVGTKPYAATGKYIHRMSNYCRHCPFDPKKASGDDACPFTTLYWTFLERHAQRLRGNRRMTFQLKNLDRKGTEELTAIRKREQEVRRRAAAGTL